MSAKQERLKMLKMLNEAKEVLLSDYPHTQRATINAKGKLYAIMHDLIMRSFAAEVQEEEIERINNIVETSRTWDDFRD